MRNELERLVAQLNAGRRYAPFFGHDKHTRELNAAEEFVESINSCDGLGLVRLRRQSNDPPDFTCTNHAGEKIAIEITEVVCSVAARLNAKRKQVYRNWRPGELTSHVAAAMERKDAKRFHGGPYDRTLVCLFTDEPALTPEGAIAELGDACFGPFKQLTSCFLLFSYQASTKMYPVITLRQR